MKVNQLHINLSKCAHMYFRPNLNNNERNACAGSNVYMFIMHLVFYH